MLYDFEDGKDLPIELKAMQHDILPTMNTDLINVSYKLEVIVKHEGMMSTKQEVPSIFFPIVVAKDPKGPLENPPKPAPQMGNHPPPIVNPYEGQGAP